MMEITYLISFLAFNGWALYFLQWGDNNIKKGGGQWLE